MRAAIVGGAVAWLCFPLAILAGDPPAAPRSSVETPETPAVERSIASYQVPAVMLTDQDGREIALQALLQAAEPTVLNFVFTSCRAICPVLSNSFAALQRDAGAGVTLISVSIDPEFDTPQVLQNYARRFSAGPSWRFLTGRAKDIVAVQRAFGAYPGEKNAHQPLTFLRRAGSHEWIRLTGFPSTGQMLSELNLEGAPAQ